MEIMETTGCETGRLLFADSRNFGNFAKSKQIRTMLQEITVRVTPKVAATPELLIKELERRLHIPASEINDWRIVRRSVDARQRQVMINLNVSVAYGDDKEVTFPFVKEEFKKLPPYAPQVVVVGAGPAGLFAALEAIALGLKPILLERGKDVDQRRIDLARISRESRVDPESNYCFGEGGAGAYSDGKLFTRSKKRGDIRRILQLLYQFGANESVLVDAHPHIGSDRLPDVIKNIRNTIIECGGEVRFSTHVSGLIMDDGEVKGVRTTSGEKFLGPVILATGHSARDVYRMLKGLEIPLEAKGFAMGVRLEHPQDLIDRIQYHSRSGRGKYLPAADYSFVTQVGDRGVYSFCMCPGGVIVPAASSPGELVVNGMSASARGGRWANSGMVVEIRPGDFPEYEKFGELQLMHLQEDVEKRFFESAGETLNAPAQRMTDFVNARPSASLPKGSYPAGMHPGRVDKLLPEFVSSRLRQGFRDFDSKARGFLTEEATVVGLESRTSSPVRIPRDQEKLNHITVKGLYPAGEGAGYAGGIVSAAIDGQRCMRALRESAIT